ncbi:hypothetical protein [Corynebacterium sp. CNJ-954]|uniref:hypothetical protein n=1 Tax=Corynebacterium sp. CNJ-954 TaxID=1904962 RepID=UPI0013016B0F|nr:hypothetical protein [Corynebacterium sp. CNJ-954]
MSGIFRTAHVAYFESELCTLGPKAEDTAWQWTKDFYDAKTKPSPGIIYTTTPPKEN